jgi:hypothetical protein
MRKDQQRDRARLPSPALGRGQEDALGGQLAQMHRLLPEAMRRASPEERRELQRLLDSAEQVAAYQAMGDEIEAAAQALEAHRAEFEVLMEDVDAVADRVRRLFSEERFLPLRYTAADVYRAFEAVGYPQRYDAVAEENEETIVAAILHLADKDHREYRSRQLLMMLPEYVSAERYLDAWLIQYSAFRMLEAPDRSNPVLAEMFQHGFVEWVEQVEAQQEAVFRELGLDRSALAGMSADEAEAWLRAQMDDPAKRAQLDAYYAAHPMMSDGAHAEVEELERGTLRLLERNDADFLYLAPEEVQPWMPSLLERLAPITAQAWQAAQQGDLDEAGAAQETGSILVEVAEEMVPAIFTPERVGQLVGQLKDYRRELMQAGEKDAAMYAHTAYVTLEREDTTAENYLLTGICFASLREMLRALSEEARARAEDGAETV